MQFGGTTIAGILTGQIPSWMMSKSAFPALLLAWWLIFHMPGDSCYRFLEKSSGGKVALFICGIYAAISNAHATGSWGMDKVLSNTFHTNSSEYHSSWFICILAGTISACGGGILCDVLGFFDHRHNKSFTLSSTSHYLAITPPLH